MAFLETAITMGVSSFWRVISIKGTHLVQRMSLLTLIIPSAGVMGLAKTCQIIVKSGVFEFNALTVSNMACAVFILYFICKSPHGPTAFTGLHSEQVLLTNVLTRHAVL
jgi:hypothetical protein